MKFRLLKNTKLPDIRKTIAKVAPLSLQQKQALEELTDQEVAEFIASHFGISEDQVLRKAALYENIGFLNTLPTPFLRVLIGHPTLKELKRRAVVPIVKNVGEITFVGCNPSEIYKLYPLAKREEIALSTCTEIYRVIAEIENNIRAALSPEKDILQALLTMREEAARFSSDKITITVYSDTLEYALNSIHGERAAGIITPELRSNLIDTISALSLTEMPLILGENFASVRAVSTTTFEVIYQCSMQSAHSL